MEAWYQKPFADVFIPESQQLVTDAVRLAVRSFAAETTKLLDTESTKFLLLWSEYCPVEALDRAKILSGLSESKLDAFVRHLPPKKPNFSLHGDNDSTRLRKSKEIVSRLDRVPLTKSLINPEWLLSRWKPGLPTDEAAGTLNQRVCTLFDIPFTEVVRWLCGLRSRIIDSRQCDLLSIRHQLCRRLATDPTFRTELEQVNEVLFILNQLTIIKF